MAIKEYKPGTAFPGVIGRTVGESSPAWPRPLRAKPGAPNVLFIVLDDTGFGQLGCYGSPIRTPNLDRLAARRPALHQHAHDRALLAEPLVHADRPQPPLERDGVHHRGRDRLSRARNGMIPFENGFLSEMLLPHGYNTYAIGKWHLTPAEQSSAAGPYDRWPLGRGFERYYGFLGGDTHQYYPDLVYDNHQVEPPRTPEEGYHLTEDLVDHAIEFIADCEAGRARQAVLHVLLHRARCTRRTTCRREWADKYKGQFDDGWDALPREGVRSGSSSWASSRRTRSCPRAIRTSRRGTRCAPTRSGSTRA